MTNVKCKKCNGYSFNVCEGYIKLVNDGMLCNCGGELELIDIGN